MLNATFRPLHWVGPTTKPLGRRSRATFKATWQETLFLLDYELRQLDARDVVVEADFRDQDIRLDGWPRANAPTPKHPGVRLFFTSRHGPLMYATDRHDWWQHNVRAIALGLQALRAVDRYGITNSGEQYTGWKALPAAAGTATARPTTAAEAADHLAGHAGWEKAPEWTDHAHMTLAYRTALRRHHPDTGGDPETFKDVTAAWAVYTRATGRQ